MRKANLLLFFFLIISIQINANVLDDLIIKKKPLINEILIELIAAGLNDQTDNSNPKLGVEICLAGGSRDCKDSWRGPDTIAQGICMAGGSIYCKDSWRGPKTIEEAIDNIPFKDRTFWWDRFRDQYGNYQWRCRGGQTKQFAENSKCSGVSKDDDRWPG